MAHRWEIYKDKKGEYRVRFKFNSEILWSSQGYVSKASAQNLIDSVRRNGPDAPVEDFAAEIADLRRRLERAPIPASDRIVRIDDNSEGKKEFSDALKKLTETIRTSNDFGDLTDEEIDVMKSEISTIDPISEHKWIRPAHLWQIAKSTLLWLVDRVAGTVVEKLALALLAALAAMLGIPF